MSHAFLAEMGGIALRLQDDDPCPILRAAGLAGRVGMYGTTSINKKDIKDKSKGDVCTKALAVLQTAWFMIQLINRRAEHLPITPIELASVALALTSLTTLGFWREKPLDVRCSYLIKLGHIPSVNIPDTGTSQTKSEETESEESVTLTHAFVLRLEEIEFVPTSPANGLALPSPISSASVFRSHGWTASQTTAIPKSWVSANMPHWAWQLLHLRLFISWTGTLLLRPKQSFSFGVQTAASCGHFSRRMVQQKYLSATEKGIRGW